MKQYELKWDSMYIWGESMYIFLSRRILSKSLVARLWYKVLVQSNDKSNSYICYPKNVIARC